MTTQTRQVPTGGDRDREPPGTAAGGRLPVAVAAGSLLYGVLGALWTVGMAGFPFGEAPADGARVSPLAFLPASVAALIVAVAGLVGIPAALALRRTGWSGSASRPLLMIAAAEVLVFGIAAPDVNVVIAVGYLLVLLGLPAGLVFLVAGAIRQRITRLLLAGLLAAAVVTELVTGIFDWAAFRHLGEGLATIPGKVGFRPWLVLGAAALAVGWIVLAIRGLRAARGRCVRCGRPGARWTRPAAAARWGRWPTIVAVLCPLPYALLRFTWLLPDPIGMDAAELRAEPGIRLFGLGLGAIALASGLVCLGLIRPWGEIWPRWMPLVAGRPVPLRAVVIPGGIAAAALVGGTVPMTLLTVQSGGRQALLEMLVFPFPLWGAAVGLATLAYYLRRRGGCRFCGVRGRM